MKTHFITTEITLQTTPAAIQQQIQMELEKYGNPLRWAITRVNLEQQTLTVEAIVTQED